MSTSVHGVVALELVTLHCIHMGGILHNARALVGWNKATMRSVSVVDDRNRDMKAHVAGIWDSRPHSKNLSRPTSMACWAGIWSDSDVGSLVRVKLANVFQSTSLLEKVVFRSESAYGGA